MVITNIFKAAEAVKRNILNSIDPQTVVQKTGVVAINSNGDCLHFKSLNQAINLNGGHGYVFSYIYRYGQVELTPEG